MIMKKIYFLLFSGMCLIAGTIYASNSQKSINGEKNHPLRINTFDLSKVDSIINVANSYVEVNFTVPSWTSFRRAFTTASLLRDSVSTDALQTAISSLKSKDMPYNINSTINK